MHATEAEGVGTPSEGCGIHTAARAELSEQLHRLSPVLAGLYDRAIATLDEPCCSADRIMVIGHCVRELTNNLAEALGDVDNLPPWSDTSKPSRDLVRVWAKHMGSTEDFVAQPSGSETQTAPPLVSVRAEVLVATYEVVKATEAGTGNARKKNSAVVLGYIKPEPDVSVTIYHNSANYFPRIAHLNKLDVDALPGNEEILKHLEIIETVIRVRLSNFFSTVTELDPLVAAANRKLPPSDGSTV